MKSKIAFVLLIILTSVFSHAQVYTYYLNTDLSSVAKKDATVLGKGSKKDNLFKLDCYSITGSQLYLTFHFVDSTLGILSGPYHSYYKDGVVEEAGNYQNNMKEGLWQKWDSIGRKIDSAIYRNDKEMFVAHFQYHKNNRISYASFKDSLLNTLNTFSYDSNSVVTHEVHFSGDIGTLKTFTDKGATIDSLFTREEIEAEFKGGAREWTNYVRKNLDPEVPVRNNAPSGVYKIMVRFIIRPDGNLSDISAETNYGYGMEKEAIRLIRNSPQWIPAKQYGRFVNAYRRQPVTFVVQSE